MLPWLPQDGDKIVIDVTRNKKNIIYFFLLLAFGYLVICCTSGSFSRAPAFSVLSIKGKLVRLHVK